MNTSKLASACALGLGSVALVAAPADADPKSEVIDLVCDNGSSYAIAVNGNGEFTPGHDTGSTTVLVPTSFSGFHFVVTDAEGNVVYEEHDDSTATKGRADKQRGTSTTCTFSSTETFEDPELAPGVLTGTFSGSVSGFTTPAR